MIRYSFSEVMAELENDNHLAFTLYGEMEYRHLTLDSGGLYLSNDTGDRKEFKVDSSTLETVWFSPDKGGL